ncbi:hypothetical protein OOT55_05395 [Marinimicrobium sp. C6131]|uniref:hypothetical protein n=1 Tax=Marinimicrobium sp. C6131 TaxID=3022676 RepID=UPI00223DAEA6|nr:hypothetical protein [Marinimicrobium sp. C6131]UZJ45489.1 hypothetical protein OOT55_05395 [Marinimicrobium sp. C6131]
MNKDANVNTDLDTEQMTNDTTATARYLKVLVTGSLMVTLTACQGGSASDEQQAQPLPENLTTCPTERPEVCTQQYDPVCGYFRLAPRDDGVTSSREWATEAATGAGQMRTFGNACSACMEESVIGFVRGECRSPSSE